MNKRILDTLLIFVLLFVYACKKKEAHLFQDSRIDIKAMTGQAIDYKVYRLPRGSFRGVSWEFKDKHAFVLWLIDKNGKDFDVFIPVSDEFLKYDEEGERETFREWMFNTMEDIERAQVIYVVSNEKKSISLRVQLPFKEGKGYDFAALTDHKNSELVMFMDLSNRIIDKNDEGIFGYIIVEVK